MNLGNQYLQDINYRMLEFSVHQDGQAAIAQLGDYIGGPDLQIAAGHPNQPVPLGVQPRPTIQPVASGLVVGHPLKLLPLPTVFVRSADLESNDDAEQTGIQNDSTSSNQPNPPRNETSEPIAIEVNHDMDIDEPIASSQPATPENGEVEQDGMQIAASSPTQPNYMDNNFAAQLALEFNPVAEMDEDGS